MTPRAAVVALAMAAMATASPARAAQVVYTGTLSGAAEIPPAATTASGNAIVTLDMVAVTMTVHVDFSGLTAANTAAHIHCCAVQPANVGVATVTPTFTGFPSGTTSGTYDHTFDMTLASSYNAAFITANGGTVVTAWAALTAGIAAGRSYLNIHTINFPGGEIRGILIAAPVLQGNASRKDHAGTPHDLPLAP